MSGVRTPAMGGQAMFESDAPVRMPTRVNDVVISNGFNKFHLAAAAAEVDRRDRLAAFITGAYPTQSVAALAGCSRIHRAPKIARLLARNQRHLDDRRVHALWLSEGVNGLAGPCRRITGLQTAGSAIDRFSMKLYATQAVRPTKAARRTARIYHYRSGFGHRSAVTARENGMVLLCDHSIAHPAVLEYLVDHGGSLPPLGLRLQPSPRWAEILADIAHADAVLVNSRFVKETFLHQGWDASKIHVIYLGVEDGFLDALHARPHAARSGALRLAFVGAVCKRKGAHSLFAALASLDDVDWRLDLIGFIDPDASAAYAGLLEDPRVRCLGTRSYIEVAQTLSNAEVFVFPSLAEGSARAVFEALASGCYVITTPNAGSIVEDGVHGTIVPPGDVAAIANAIRSAAADRERVNEIGRSNEILVRSSYRQEDYGAALVALYDSLLAEDGRRSAR